MIAEPEIGKLYKNKNKSVFFVLSAFKKISYKKLEIVKHKWIRVGPNNAAKLGLAKNLITEQDVWNFIY